MAFYHPIADGTKTQVFSVIPDPHCRHYLRLKGCYELDAKMLQLAQPDMPVLHPLPRIDEIKLDVDNDPHAAYFDQVHNGVYIRMAIILALLGVHDPLTGKKVLEC